MYMYSKNKMKNIKDLWDSLSLPYGSSDMLLCIHWYAYYTSRTPHPWHTAACARVCVCVCVCTCVCVMKIEWLVDELSESDEIVANCWRVEGAMIDWLWVLLKKSGKWTKCHTDPTP